MRKTQTAAGVIALGIIFLSAVNAYANTTYNVPEGGTWSYGMTPGINAFSDFYHPVNFHGSKVVNRNNGMQSTGSAGAGVWSKASIWDIWDPASYYYNPYGGY